MQGHDGKVALVTGAARGQGRSHAVRLAAEGADIIALDIGGGRERGRLGHNATDADLDETARLIRHEGRRVFAAAVDVRDRAALEAAVATGLGQFGQLDIVIANAGVSQKARPFWKIDPTHWNEVLETNLTGAWHTISACAPGMIERGAGGSMVIIASSAAIRPVTNLAAYVASKHALIGLMKVAAMELGEYSIRVNAIATGGVHTAMIQPSFAKVLRPDLERPTEQDSLDALREQNLLRVPWIEPEDVSDAVAWISSDQARFVTGTVLTVDAGYLLSS
jgi:(+)-trans-carveol dehydrogenase